MKDRDAKGDIKDWVRAVDEEDALVELHSLKDEAAKSVAKDFVRATIEEYVLMELRDFVDCVNQFVRFRLVDAERYGAVNGKLESARAEVEQAIRILDSL